MFSEELNKAKNQYKKFVLYEDSSMIRQFFGKKNQASFLGSHKFVEWVKATFRRSKADHEVPKSRQLAPTITDVKKKVRQSYRVDEQTLKQTKRGQTNEPRNIARKRCGLARVS